jgi:hypothetical protein
VGEALRGTLQNRAELAADISDARDYRVSEPAHSRL